MSPYQEEAFPKKIVAVVVAGVVSLIMLFASATTVSTGHRGIVTHFGKVQAEILDEGFHWVMPFITSVYEMPIQIQKDPIETSAASKDMQTIRGHIAVNWQIEAGMVSDIYQRIGTLSVVVDNIMVPAVNEVFKAITAKYSAENILTQRAELKVLLDKELGERLGKYNIHLLDASIQDINFSEEFNNAIEAKQIAEQNAQKAKYDTDRAKQEAEAEVNKAKGKAEAMRLMSQTVSPKILQQQAIEKWNGVLPQIMGTGAVPFVDLKNLTPKANAEE
jgi:regulator of protease activity HflC (stomatin/prohibitin superfamily)